VLEGCMVGEPSVLVSFVEAVAGGGAAF
jgi:hypothetical protein